MKVNITGAIMQMITNERKKKKKLKEFCWFIHHKQFIHSLWIIKFINLILFRIHNITRISL